MLSKVAIASALLCVAPLAASAAGQPSSPEEQAYLEKIDSFYANIDGAWNWSTTVLSPELAILERGAARSTIAYDRERHAVSQIITMETSEGTRSYTSEIEFLSQELLQVEIQQGQQVLFSGQIPNTLALRDNHLSAYLRLGGMGLMDEMMGQYQCEEMYRHVVILEDRILSHADCLQGGQHTLTIVADAERAAAE
jgi:hypothetical protein